MEFSLITDDIKLGLLVMAVFIIAIVAFWPLMSGIHLGDCHGCRTFTHS